METRYWFPWILILLAVTYSMITSEVWDYEVIVALIRGNSFFKDTACKGRRRYILEPKRSWPIRRPYT
jgi:hypothetical protein